LGSKIQESPSGSASTLFASIGNSGGETGNFTLFPLLRPPAGFPDGGGHLSTKVVVFNESRLGYSLQLIYRYGYSPERIKDKFLKLIDDVWTMPKRSFGKAQWHARSAPKTWPVMVGPVEAVCLLLLSRLQKHFQARCSSERNRRGAHTL
jgi:hypothetical protein